MKVKLRKPLTAVQECYAPPQYK